MVTHPRKFHQPKPDQVSSSIYEVRHSKQKKNGKKKKKDLIKFIELSYS